jgi:integrase
MNELQRSQMPIDSYNRFGARTSTGGEFPVRRSAAARPFHFVSLQRLDDDVARAIRHAAEVEGLREKTISWCSTGYRQLRRYLSETGADRIFLRGEPDAQARVLEEWIAWMRNRGSMHGTVRAHWCSVLLIFDRLTKLDGTQNPLRAFQRPRASAPVPRAIAREDAERLLSYLRNASGGTFIVERNLALVACMLFAGLRRGEVLRLDLADVDHASRTIRIRRSKGRDGGKSRTAYIPQQLADILRAYERERDAVGHGADVAYFITEKRDRRVNDGAIRRLFATIYKNTGLRLSPHMLRHTYVTLLRQAGVADRLTMDLAGHTSLAMTQRYSAVFSGEHLAAADQLLLDF